MTDGASFTALEVANLHGVNRSTVYRRIRNGYYEASKNAAGRWVITFPMPAIQTTTPEVAITRTVEAPRKSLWAYRRELHGF